MIFISVEVDGLRRLIVNRVIRLSYGSHLKLFCRGHGTHLWEYLDAQLHNPEFTITKKKLFNSYCRSNAVISVNKFDYTYVGFYSCFRVTQSEMEETILVTNCK